MIKHLFLARDAVSKYNREDYSMVLVIATSCISGIIAALVGFGVQLFTNMTEQQCIFIAVCSGLVYVLYTVLRWCNLLQQRADGKIVDGKVVKQDSERSIKSWVGDIRNERQ
ncbi:hypothetical protein [Erwinia phage FBB1]|nr:hypothetical protein [Erwinia phage FBB1]